MRKFSYHRPNTVAHAREILADYNGKAIVLAAGTDIIPKLRRGALTPDALVSLSGIEELRKLEKREDGSLFIGASVTLIDLAESRLIGSSIPAICRTSSLMGSPQVRNRATAGGNLCNGAPSADLSTCLLALGAKATVAVKDGLEKTVPLDEFFQHVRVEVAVASMAVAGDQYIVLLGELFQFGHQVRDLSQRHDDIL